MNRFLLGLAGSVAAATLAYEVVTPAAASEGEKVPQMMSFTDLKWTELPERKGMQFAILSGDPKVGPYTQMRKVRPALTTRFTRTAVN